MMRTVKIYVPPGQPGPLSEFLASLDEKLRQKLLRQIFLLAQIPLCDLKEPHFKHFVLEKYSQLYELREKSKVLVRIIFTIRDGDIILLVPFIKRQSRDTMKALEQSLKMLADIRENPEFAVYAPLYAGKGHLSRLSLLLLQGGDGVVAHVGGGKYGAENC